MQHSSLADDVIRRGVMLLESVHQHPSVRDYLLYRTRHGAENMIPCLSIILDRNLRVEPLVLPE